MGVQRAAAGTVEPVPAPFPGGPVGGAPGVVPAAAAPPAPTPAAGDQVIPVDPVRRRIAEKMLLSKHEAPHAWSMMQVDVTGLVRLREQVGAEFKQRQGIGLSCMPFFIKAVVESLREYPILNSQWAGDAIVIKREVNISIAVATETALAVPVIRNADLLSIAGLNQAVADLAARARAGRLTVEDVTGGTFTVNNTGAFGSFLSAPIINHPQAAILSFEAITRTPVVLENDAIAIRSMMNICLSLDHRILDGLVCGRFLQAVKRRLESYGPGTVNLY
jgi:2-oxoisovalerate dehydrogenase E2 component (dihydrolipoyl transacylase)